MGFLFLSFSTLCHDPFSGYIAEDLSGLSTEEHRQYENRHRTYSLRSRSSSHVNAGSGTLESSLQYHNQQVQSSKSIADLDSVRNNDVPQTSFSASLPGLVPASHAITRTGSDCEPFQRAYLPAYRPAPDYETAIRHKYGSGDATVINLAHQFQSKCRLKCIL